MENLTLQFLRTSILFVRNAYNCFNSPYITYRKLSQERIFGQTMFIILSVFSYFLFVSVVRNGLSNPFLLTVKFNSLVFSAVVGFLATIILIFILGRLFGGKGRIGGVYNLWIFSLIPTLIWFFATSLLYLILPPPRTLSFWGKFYSVVYAAFSMSVFIWKAILYYLTLRFALKLDLWRIILVTAVLLPILSVFSVGMYRLGIFRIPFI